MSNRADCQWCGYSYAEAKPGREYFLHDEQECEFEWLRKTLRKLLHACGDSSQYGDHMTACDQTMGSTHPCTCGADEARKLI